MFFHFKTREHDLGIRWNLDEDVFKKVLYRMRENFLRRQTDAADGFESSRALKRRTDHQNWLHVSKPMIIL